MIGETTMEEVYENEEIKVVVKRGNRTAMEFSIFKVPNEMLTVADEYLKMVDSENWSSMIEDEYIEAEQKFLHQKVLQLVDNKWLFASLFIDASLVEVNQVSQSLHYQIV
jgi:hypothetical protein